jgi:ATP diphosphatase
LFRKQQKTPDLTRKKIKFYVWEKGNMIEISDASVRKSRHLNEIEETLSYKKLKSVVEILRKECPNDRKETFESVIDHLIEETGELKQELDKNKRENCKEELGDILFNVFLLSCIAEEHKLFEMKDMIDFVTEKMIRRHDEIFKKQ